MRLMHYFSRVFFFFALNPFTAAADLVEDLVGLPHLNDTFGLQSAGREGRGGML